jgi:hypothetical protein
MRLAVIIHGEPRFCEEFDHLIERIKDVEQVDWFFYLWSETEYPTDEEIIKERTTNAHPHTYGFNVVAPKWRSINRDWAMQKLRENLPAHHNIVRAEFVDHRTMSFAPIEENYAEEVNLTNICKNWYSLKQVDLFRQQYEKDNNFTYDMVLRSRADIAITSDLNLSEITNGLHYDKSVIFIPSNRQCGYHGIHFCDLLAIASSKNMTVYSDLIDQAWEHHRNGCIFHGETMMARHILNNGLQYRSAGFTIELRWLGQDHAEPGGIYISKYGRWE